MAYDIPTIPKTDTLLLGSQNTLVVLHAEKLVSLGNNNFWYGPETSNTLPIKMYQCYMSRRWP